MTNEKSRGVRFDELKNPEIAAALYVPPLVLMPFGRTEQHGQHLPTGTDDFASLTTGDLGAPKIGGLVLGGMQFGITSLHMDFPRTVTVSASVYEVIHLEMASSLDAHGVKDIAYVNYGGMKS